MANTPISGPGTTPGTTVVAGTIFPIGGTGKPTTTAALIKTYVNADPTFTGTATVSVSGSYLNFSSNLINGKVIKFTSTQDATYGSFLFNMAESGSDPELDAVMYMGWNTAPGGGVVVAGKAANRLGFERHYAGISSDDFETYYEVTPITGSSVRHWAFNTKKSDGSAIGYSSVSLGYDFRVSNAGASYAGFLPTGGASFVGSSAQVNVQNSSDSTYLIIQPQSGNIDIGSTGTLADGSPHFTLRGSVNGSFMTRFSNTRGGTAEGNILSLLYGGAERHYIQGLPSNHGTFPFGLLIRNLTANAGVAIYNGQYALVADGSGRIGINGTTSPTANLHLPAGAATAGFAPFTFTTGGTELTTPANGVLEPATGDANLKYHAGGVKYTLAKTLTNTATLNFGSTAAGAATDLTITVTGAADGDPVSLGVPNASTVSDGSFTAWVSSANTVTVRFTNNNLVSALDPASGTFRVSVIHY